ncbi:hypothetical protein [Pseudomonas sp. FYR_11]|uniref:hypothetical protein n=1 Tax=Pseudomonas TaxID=286 RepID=UPI00370C0B57
MEILNSPELEAIFEEGKKAFHMGTAFSACPYIGRFSMERSWSDGWVQAYETAKGGAQNGQATAP